MREFPKDAVRTQDILREFFPDEQWPSPEQLAEPPDTDDASAEAGGRPMVFGVPAAQTPQDMADEHNGPAWAEAAFEAPMEQSAIEQPAYALPDPAYALPELDHGRRTPQWLVPALVLLACVVVGVIGFVVGSMTGGGSGAQVATEQDSAAGGQGGAVIGTETTDIPVSNGIDGGEQQPAVTGPAADVRPFIEPTPNATEWPGYPEDPADAPATGPYIIVTNGDFFLRGTVGTEELRQQMAWSILQLVSPESVVMEYQLDPADPFALGDDIPLYFDDVILFDANSEVLNEDELRELALLGVAFLQANPRAAITFTGHTDSLGSDAENLDLSLRRAETVRDFYIGLGAPPDRLIAVGQGDAEPIAGNNTDTGRAANRRVEFSFTYER